MFFESQGYERFMGRWSRILAPAFLDFVGLDCEGKALDVGTGTGVLVEAFLAKSPFGEIVGVDPAEAYVRHARKQVTDGRATFEVGDARRLRFDSGAFDATISLLVISFIPDPPGAAAEMSRVTKPGGVVAAAVWDYGEGMQMLRVFWDAVVAMDPSSGGRDERNMPYCTPGQLRMLWEGAGLVGVEVSPITVPTVFRSFGDYWEPFLEKQGPAGSYVSTLQETNRRKLEGLLRKRLSPGGNDGEILLSARAWAVKGRVPFG